MLESHTRTRRALVNYRRVFNEMKLPQTDEETLWTTLDESCQSQESLCLVLPSPPYSAMSSVVLDASPVPPPALLCPITLQLFRDPVVLTSGHTYERSAVLATWTSRPGLDPMTGVVLKSRLVTNNIYVREQVQAFLDANPGYVPDGWPDAKLAPLPEIARDETPMVALGPQQLDDFDLPLPGLAGYNLGMGTPGVGFFGIDGGRGGFRHVPDLPFMLAVGGILLQFELVRAFQPIFASLPLFRHPPWPHRIPLELPTVGSVVIIACLMALHTYSLSCALLLLTVSLFGIHVAIYGPIMPNSVPRRQVAKNFALVGGVCLIAVLVMRFLQSLATRLVWRTPPFEVPWTFICCWLAIFAAICLETVRQNGRLAMINMQYRQA